MDFFDDDNNRFDASSYSSAHNHGSGRASDAAQETNMPQEVRAFARSAASPHFGYGTPSSPIPIAGRRRPRMPLTWVFV
jgi:hypothetical protein